MKFLIDGSSVRIAERKLQAAELIAGQLLTPLTRYKRCEPVFGIDNGAFSGLDLKGFTRLLKRYYEFRDQCLFVAIPDKVADHKETLLMWDKYNGLADGYKKAFVAQDGFDGWPKNVDAIFIGGSTEFKDSKECEDIVLTALDNNMHVHIGRVNTYERFYNFHQIGAHTCDGSGISMYDHMLEKLYKLFKSNEVRCQMHLAL